MFYVIIEKMYEKKNNSEHGNTQNRLDQIPLMGYN